MQRSSDSSFFRGRGFQIQLNKPVQPYQRVVSSLFISFCVIFGIWTITVISFTVYHKVVHEKSNAQLSKLMFRKRRVRIDSLVRFH